MSTICLNMIVKNEASIIVDTLTNILANIHIDYWVIADTGSDDGTQSVIQTFFQQRGIPGELLQHEWHDTSETFTGSYGAQDAVTEFNDTHERVWTLGEVVSAVTGAGFRLEFLHEHDYTLFDSLRFLVRTERGYELPEGLPRIPMMYSLRATLT